MLISETVTLLAQRYEGARFVVTCRPEGYRGGAQLGGEFQRADVQPLRWPEDIVPFVHRWNEAVLEASAHAAHENAQDLIRRLGEQDQVRDLANNPLLLTVMIIVHFNVGRLPERRADLYDNATELLLGWDTRWRRTLAAPPPWLDAIKPAGRRLYLEELAYHWQQQGVTEARREEAVAFLSASFLRGTDEEQKRQAAERAAVYLDWVIERSYLLRPLGTNVAFYRRAFQEYLAARRLAREPDLGCDDALAALGENWDWWQETVLLALDHLSASDPERAATLLQGLLNAPDDPAGSAAAPGPGRARPEPGRARAPALAAGGRGARPAARGARASHAGLCHPPARAGRVAPWPSWARTGPGSAIAFPLLVEVPGGPFAMGSPSKEVARWKQWRAASHRAGRRALDRRRPDEEEIFEALCRLAGRRGGRARDRRARLLPRPLPGDGRPVPALCRGRRL